MTKLEQEVFYETIKSLKEFCADISEASIKFPTNDYNNYSEKFKEFERQDLEALAREGWQRSHKLRNSIEAKIERLETLFIHLTQQK